MRPDSAALHLARRATYGPTPELLDEIQAIGRDTWLRLQLNPARIEDGACDQLVARFPNVGQDVAQIRTGYPGGTWEPLYELPRAHLARAFWSRRQLVELMVDFWSNHLNVTCPSNDVWDSRTGYDLVIRKHALGRFTDLLVAASTHPAMLNYLDNASSTKAHPNENQGRELLELHTVGVDAGYSEREVVDSARILTGLTVDPDTGLTAFRPADHHVGPVRVLGFRDANAHAAGGAAVIEAYLRYLARHPATARMIARKLAIRFVADAPPPSLVAALARTYLRSGTSIAPVLWQLFRSAEFSAAAGRPTKLRRPLEDLAATVRILGIGPEPSGTTAVEGLTWTLGDMGQPPLGWPLPDGYPDVATAWAAPGGALGRWTPHLNLATGWWPKTLRIPGIRALLPGVLPASRADLVDTLAGRLLFQPATPAQHAAVDAYLDSGARSGSAGDPTVDRLPELAALLLDSAEFALR